MPGYCVLTFGCRVNQADSLRLERDLQQGGLAPTDAATADLVVVNTCSVTATADQGARQAIRRVHRQNPSARLVVTGCFATRSREVVAALPGVVQVVANDRKDDLAALALGVTSAVRYGDGDGPCGAALAPGLAGRTCWTLRVQTGCEQPCAYCIIPETRGRSRSRDLDDIGREVADVAAAGFKEVAVTGVHLGAWGRDLQPSRSLADLLGALADHPADVTFRVSSLEPMDCTPDVRAILVGAGRFAPHFHLPLQHASGRVLAAMRRPYSVAYYDELVGSLRASLPHAQIGADVMVGFPGEHQADHRANLAWLECSPLSYLHVFPYSDRPGTAAETFPDKVHGAIVRRRADEVRQVGRSLAVSFRHSMLGTIRPGLTLDDGTLVVTDNGLKVRIPSAGHRNHRVHVRIVSAGDPMVGEVLEA